MSAEFFDNSQWYSKDLWERSPSFDVARAFAAFRDKTFGAGMALELQRMQMSPAILTDDPLAIAARLDFDAGAGRIVAWKQQAARSATEQRLIHGVVTKSNLLWPFLLATSLAFRLGKSRLDLLSTPRSPARRTAADKATADQDVKHAHEPRRPT